MPLSGVKKFHRELFDALNDNKTVFVSKHGRIVAAFRPYAYVPESVVAAYASPNLQLPVVTARDIQRTSLSQPVAAAAAGLPAVVEKDSRIYGLLTPAHAPRPASIPDPDVVDARAGAMLDYQKRHPDASIDDIMAFADQFDADHSDQAPAQSWPLAPEFEDDDAVDADIEKWRKSGSDIEDLVEEIFSTLAHGIAAGADDVEVAVPALTRTRVAEAPDRLDVALSFRVFVADAEKLEAADETLSARAGYVRALTTAPGPNSGVMWRLGNLARRTDHCAEAARWFRLSLAYDEALPHHRVRWA